MYLEFLAKKFGPLKCQQSLLGLGIIHTHFHRLDAGYFNLLGENSIVRPEQLNCSNYNAIVCPPR
jgi:hypothetical protein